MIPVLLALAAILVQQAPTFRSGAEAVRVDVLVTDRGKPVTGLRASDFELSDNGVRQEIRLLEFDELPLHVVLAFDMSASVTAERLERLRRAAGALLDGLSQRDRAGLITFSHAVTRRQSLTDDLSRLRDELSRVEPAGGTALVDGAYASLIVSEPQDGRALLVIFSDGLDTASWLSPDAVLDIARRSDVVVYSVSTGREKPAFLRALSEVTGGAAFENQSAEDLEKRFLGVLEEFRRRYVLVYTPTGSATPGWHRLDVRVKGRRATVKARPGYMAGGPGSN
jgi:VWFA-related protein